MQKENPTELAVQRLLNDKFIGQTMKAQQPSITSPELSSVKTVSEFQIYLFKIALWFFFLLFTITSC